MTRAEAKALGLRYYDPGRPCRHGHVSVWLTARGCCQACQQAFNAKPENKQRRAAWQASPEGKTVVQRVKAQFRARHPTKSKDYDALPETKDRRRARVIAKYATDPQWRAWYLDTKRAWRRTNADKMAFWATERRHYKGRATLILPEHRAQVQALYQEARRLGHEVDHIVPLKGQFVCGLHILCNLQILPRRENRAKGNQHTP